MITAVIALVAVGCLPITVWMMLRHQVAQMRQILNHVYESTPIGGIPPDIRRKELELAEKKMENERISKESRDLAQHLRSGYNIENRP